MRTALMTMVAAATLTAGCATLDDNASYSAYDYNRPDPRYGNYYANRYYRADRRYAERALNAQDRVYRGEDGRYYCRRPDGTTGLVVGGVAGGALGAAIAPGGSELLGALIGGAVGAAVGQQVERNEVRCR